MGIHVRFVTVETGVGMRLREEAMMRMINRTGFLFASLADVVLAFSDTCAHLVRFLFVR